MDPRTPTIGSVRIIPLVMALGVVAITGGAVALRLSGSIPGNPEVARVLTMAVAALAFGLVPAFLLLRRGLVARLRAERDASLALLKQGRVPPAGLTLTIVSAALPEGLGLLGAVAVLLGGPWAVLAAPALAVVVILLLMPTRERLEALVRG